MENVTQKAPEISVIVPVYNVQAYLPRCLDSILAQTFRDMEIILVDDGSPDESGAICDEYAARDERVRVIHKANGGVSSARNAGLDVARGRWIGFVDSDDYIAPDMYEYLHSIAIREQAQIAMCDAYMFYDNGVVEEHPNDFYRVTDKVEAARIVLEAQITSVTAWNKLYRWDVYDGIRFPEGKTAEDAFVILDVLAKAERIVISNAQKYYYYRRVNSITMKAFNPRDLDAVEAYEANASKAMAISPTLADAALLRRCWARFYVLDKFMLSGDSVRAELVREYTSFLRENCGFILKSRVFTKGRKLGLLALLVSPSLYRTIVRRFTARHRTPNA